MRIFGVILAGGSARRMGGADKARLLLGGQTLLARAIDRLEPQVERLAVSANGDPSRLDAGSRPVLADMASLGPLSGIHAALDWAAPLGATHLVSVAVDTPFFPADLVPRLLLAADSSLSGVALAQSGGQVHPTFALWPVALRADLQAALLRDERRITGFAARHDAAFARFPDDRAFLNLNTPDDLVAAKAMVAAAP